MNLSLFNGHIISAETRLNLKPFADYGDVSINKKPDENNNQPTNSHFTKTLTLTLNPVTLTSEGGV